MTYYISGTVVISNTPNVDWNRLINLPNGDLGGGQFAGLIMALSANLLGDLTNLPGSAGVIMASGGYDPPSGTLVINFDTNCAGEGACVACTTDCACGG